MQTNLRRLLLALVFATAGLADAQETPLYDNLGSHSTSISTTSSEAQKYFDQGLRLYYAFNHAEAIRAFDAAIEHDSECAICYWGIALSHGPNINVPMSPVGGALAYEHVRDALSLADDASPRERALIGALANRYGEDPTVDRAERDRAYADAMAHVFRSFPDDHDIATLFVESLMDLNPWDYWHDDGTPREGTSRFLMVLEDILEVDVDHPGANHLYIHAVEEVDPYRAVDAAERLASLMPGAGHIVHMPGHIYVRVGRYEDAILANEHAVHADETYIGDHNPEVGVYVAGYYPHNYDFMSFAASMIGRENQAIDAAESVREVIPVEMIDQPGMEFLQNRVTRHLQMKVRFGRWQEILAEDSPGREVLHARGIWHYARGRALLGTGRIAEARIELAALREIRSDSSLEGKRLLFNSSRTVLSLAEYVLEAHLVVAEGDVGGGIDLLHRAVSLEDSMTYGEPPEWSIPVRQELGAVLLDVDMPKEALKVFTEDLQRFPGNPWSLFGSARALEADGHPVEAAATMEHFRRMWQGIGLPGVATP